MKDSIFSPAFIEELKAKNDIVNIIGKYVRLEKKGKNFWGCCPFHHEKTPSFCINEYEQFYHCFGCGESGDVITFLRKFENMEYIDAIKLLAENAGMKLPEIEENQKFAEAKKQKDKSLKILEIAKNFYKENLYTTNAKPAQDYIKKRKLTKRELDDFELGYSPNFFQIVNLLKSYKFTDAEMKASGVCELGKSGKPYDFLSERLIFPIVDAQGDCIGFSGRDLSGSGYMKYKNTSATVVFNKSKAIYGINLVKKLKQEKGLDTIILVEGQFDVITMHRFGFKNTVACLGTAITKDHLRQLKRFADNIILCLDGDSAGQKATLRTLEVFREMPELNVKVAVLHSGQDPDEFLSNNGVEGMQKLLQNTLSPMAFRIFVFKNKYNLNSLDEKMKFIKEVIAEIKKLSTNAEQEIYLAELGKLTNVSIDILRRDLDSSSTPLVAKQSIEKPAPAPELDANIKAVKFVLASMLHKKDYADFWGNLEEYIINPSLKKLYKLLLAKHKEGTELKISSLYDIFDVETDTAIQDVINFQFSNITNPKEYFLSSVWQMIENELKFRKATLSKQYKEEIVSSKKVELLMQINEIDKQLKKKNLGDFI
ncbi:MAG: DNA primase [Clostridia bacterium]|nr:DNA primase [Clostridia bacterium]